MPVNVTDDDLTYDTNPPDGAVSGTLDPSTEAVGSSTNRVQLPSRNYRSTRHVLGSSIVFYDKEGEPVGMSEPTTGADDDVCIFRCGERYHIRVIPGMAKSG